MMTEWRCAYCEHCRALGAQRIPIHLHYSVLEGILVTEHWSDGSRTFRTIWGSRIEGRAF